jgi:quercetin dioxygenase-like cupin family protein
MQHWDIRSVDVEAHQPKVLHTEGEGRTIVINLPAGEALQDHEVHERAWLFVADGEVEIEAGEDSVSGGVGLFATFDPKERHEVRATSDARLVLVLGPWPGAGHPSER